MHKHIIFFMGVLGCSLVTGCGGSSSSSNGFTCQESEGAAMVCYGYTNLPAADLSAEQAACTAAKGTAGTSCSTTNALGTCALTEAGVTANVTYYSTGGLTAATAQSGCKSAGGTWTAS